MISFRAAFVVHRWSAARLELRVPHYSRAGLENRLRQPRFGVFRILSGAGGGAFSVPVLPISFIFCWETRV
jgi:hypothetical protein